MLNRGLQNMKVLICLLVTSNMDTENSAIKGSIAINRAYS